MKKLSSIVFVFFILFSFSQALAQLRLPGIIGSHMVLQQNSEVKIWGWSYAMEKISIKVGWDTIEYKTVGSSNADWSVKVKTPAAGGPYKITISGYNTIELEDVMIGEVWLCSGQSNMDWSTGGLPQGLEESPNATNTKIRYFSAPKATADYPQNLTTGTWKVNSPEEMKHFSAVGYFFGKKIQSELNVPVGLINSSWGGTAAEIWTPQEVFERNTELAEVATKITSDWQGWPIKASLAYNAMIFPITNYDIAGVLWYQGESNTGTSSTYQPLLSGLIESWRKKWGKEFPFYIVQIAPYAYGTPFIAPLLREAQNKTLITPKTGIVVISDLVDDVNDIHPKNKKDVGLRLANLALADSYGKKDIPYKSPSYKGMKIEKNKIRIYFENAESGLISKGGAPTEFLIAGEDKIFVPATAKIEGNTIVIFNKNVKSPAAVRFGFTNTSMPNLFSKEGLPVNLFRTDNWAMEKE